MSQRRQKKQLNTGDNVNAMSDHELRSALKSYGLPPGPITDSTRNLYRKKLTSLLDESENGLHPADLDSDKRSKQREPTIEEENDDDDTSDEDYSANEDEEEEDEDEDDDLEEEEEELMSELQDDDLSASRISNVGLTSFSTRAQSDVNSVSRGLLISLIAFFVVIFAAYSLTSVYPSALEPLKPFKNVIVVLMMFLPMIYVARKVFCFYRRKQNEENRRVCELVSEALELLQSPDNPKGQMPILHVRDTLLTPVERKSKKMALLWSKAVRFVEEHESRVKVEMVNIDGEDFRAWKWIGNKKL